MSTHLGRMEQVVVDGEVVSTSLHLIHDEARVRVKEGDEFVTVRLQVDPWKPIKSKG